MGTYDPISVLEDFSRTLTLFRRVRMNTSSCRPISCICNVPPGAVGWVYGSGCFHFSSSFSVSFNNACKGSEISQWGGASANFSEGAHTRCCLGLVMFRFASNSDRMYSACPRHRCRWTAQSSASFNERRYSDLWDHQQLCISNREQLSSQGGLSSGHVGQVGRGPGLPIEKRRRSCRHGR